MVGMLMLLMWGALSAAPAFALSESDWVCETEPAVAVVEVTAGSAIPIELPRIGLCGPEPEVESLTFEAYDLAGNRVCDQVVDPIGRSRLGLADACSLGAGEYTFSLDGVVAERRLVVTEATDERFDGVAPVLDQLYLRRWNLDGGVYDELRASISPLAEVRESAALVEVVNVENTTAEPVVWTVGVVRLRGRFYPGYLPAMLDTPPEEMCFKARYKTLTGETGPWGEVSCVDEVREFDRSTPPEPEPSGCDGLGGSPSWLAWALLVLPGLVRRRRGR